MSAASSSGIPWTITRPAQVSRRPGATSGSLTLSWGQTCASRVSQSFSAAAKPRLQGRSGQPENSARRIRPLKVGPFAIPPVPPDRVPSAAGPSTSRRPSEPARTMDRDCDEPGILRSRSGTFDEQGSEMAPWTHRTPTASQPKPQCSTERYRRIQRSRTACGLVRRIPANCPQGFDYRSVARDTRRYAPPSPGVERQPVLLLARTPDPHPHNRRSVRSVYWQRIRKRKDPNGRCILYGAVCPTCAGMRRESGARTRRW